MGNGFTPDLRSITGSCLTIFSSLIFTIRTLSNSSIWRSAWRCWRVPDCSQYRCFTAVDPTWINCSLIGPSAFGSQFENPTSGECDNLMEGLYCRTEAKG